MQIGEAFRETGVVTLRSAFDIDAAAFLRSMIWRHIEQRTPARLDDPDTWAFEGNFGLREVEDRDVWHAVHNGPSVMAALDEIFEGRRVATPPAPQVLLSFPANGPWKLPTGWHIDVGFELPTFPVFAVKMFALLETVEPGGGGTLLLEGSHRLLEPFAKLEGGPLRRGDDERLLESDDYLTSLRRGGGNRSLLNRPVEVHGVPVCPVEITGDAGDVVLTHMQVWHCPSPNTTSRPRQMLGNAFRPELG